jgi:hypothetical protein
LLKLDFVICCNNTDPGVDVQAKRWNFIAGELLDFFCEPGVLCLLIDHAPLVGQCHFLHLIIQETDSVDDYNSLDIMF